MDSNVTAVTWSWENTFLPEWEHIRHQEEQESLGSPSAKRHSKSQPPRSFSSGGLTALLPSSLTRGNAKYRIEQACWAGIPPRVRAKAWPSLIGNKLMITSELFEVLRAQADEVRYQPVEEDCDNHTIVSETDTEGGEDCGAADNETPGQSLEEIVEVEKLEGVPVNQGSVEEQVEELTQEVSTMKVLTRKNTVVLQIELDLSRTYPRLAFFHAGGPFRDSLQEILEGYSLFRPGTGYVQGMSFVAAMLLLNMERDEAFVCFCNILNDHVFFHVVRHKNETIIARYMNLFQLLLCEQLPELGRHFAEIGLRPEMYVLDWLLTLLCKSLSLDATARIWDVYLFYSTRDKKERFLFRAILGLIKLFSAQLKGLEFDSALNLLRNIPSNFSIDRYMESIKSVTISSRKYASLQKQVGLTAQINTFYSGA